MMTKKTQGSTKLVAIIVISALVVVGVVAYLLINRSSGGTNSTKQLEKDSKAAEQVNKTKSESIPADLPADIPIYQPSDVQSATTRKSTRNTSYMISLISNDSAEQVLNFYNQKLSSGDWTITRNDQTHSLIAARSGMKNLDVSVSSIDKMPTMISLNVMIASEPEINPPSGK